MLTTAMQATLRSNGGNSALVLEFRGRTTYATHPAFAAAVTLVGSHSDDDHTHDMSVNVDGLLLMMGDLAELRDAIAGWVSRPMERLHAADLLGEFQLARLPGQSLLCQLGGGAGRNPVVTVRFSAGAMSGEFVFEADQSCLDLFQRDLTTALRA